MTPEAPRRAIPTTTLMIIFFPPGLPVAIMIPQMMIKTNETIKIIVTSILVRLHIKTGNAVSQVTSVSPAPTLPVEFSMQLPINGTEVLSDIPQQTPGALQDLHILSCHLHQLSYLQSLHVFILEQVTVVAHHAPPPAQPIQPAGVELFVLVHCNISLQPSGLQLHQFHDCCRHEGQFMLCTFQLQSVVHVHVSHCPNE